MNIKKIFFPIWKEARPAARGGRAVAPPVDLGTNHAPSHREDASPLCPSPRARPHADTAASSPSPSRMHRRPCCVCPYTLRLHEQPWSSSSILYRGFLPAATFQPTRTKPTSSHRGKEPPTKLCHARARALSLYIYIYIYMSFLYFQE